MVSSDSVKQSNNQKPDISEQNVPETGEEQDVVEITEEKLAKSDEREKVQERGESQSNINL